MKASSKKLRNRPAFFQNFRDNTIIFCSAVIYLQCYKKSQYFKIVNHVRKNLKKKSYWFFNWKYCFLHFLKILEIDLRFWKNKAENNKDCYKKIWTESCRFIIKIKFTSMDFFKCLWSKSLLPERKALIIIFLFFSRVIQIESWGR